MKLLLYGLWLIFGASLAFIFLKTQSWSVKVITPNQPKLSKLLIIGGAVIRWVLVFLALMFALSFSLTALFLVFIVFMVTRLLILFRWQGLLCTRLNRITHTE
jgi:hypothetical protein